MDKKKVQELVDSIEVLKNKLSSSGEYSICLKSKEMMGIAEAIELGNVFERIDNALNLVKEELNGKELSSETIKKKES